MKEAKGSKYLLDRILFKMVRDRVQVLILSILMEVMVISIVGCGRQSVYWDGRETEDEYSSPLVVFEGDNE
jgi:hypothetical protein